MHDAPSLLAPISPDAGFQAMSLQYAFLTNQTNCAKE